jgi:hypothetical protein
MILSARFLKIYREIGAERVLDNAVQEGKRGILMGYASHIPVTLLQRRRETMAKETIQIAVRIPRTTYNLVRQNAGGERALGAWINQACLAYTNQSATIARAVIEALREAGALETLPS